MFKLKHDEKGESSAGQMMTIILLTMIVLVVGLSLVVTVVQSSSSAGNESTSNKALTSLIPTIFIVMLVAVPIVGLLKFFGYI
jgi:heme/copper-type cytochrome/quinol oxidase subunit 2